MWCFGPARKPGCGGLQGHRWLHRRYQRTLARSGPNRRAQHVRHSPMGARLGLGVGIGMSKPTDVGGRPDRPAATPVFREGSPQSEGSPLQRPGHSWRGCAG
jgi:hypothetical protein